MLTYSELIHNLSAFFILISGENMKNKDILITLISAVLALAIVIFFIPDKKLACVNLLAGAFKINLKESQTQFKDNYLNLNNLVQNELGNPLKKETNKSVKYSLLTETDSDVLKKQVAFKANKNKKAAGKIYERTFINMNSQVKYGKIKVQNRTEKKINIKKILGEGARLKIKDKSKPTVLIYHTHTHESFVTLEGGVYYKGETTQSSDKSENIVRVGDAIVERLQKAGYNVIHDTAFYDDDYNNAYKHSGVGIDKILKKYPSIDVAIDIHRDSIGVEGDEKGRTAAVNTINGKKAAQIMIVTGCEEDFIKDFPNWYDNLHFAIGLQNQLQQDFEGLARPVYFADRKYNMYKTKNSVLIEVGSDGNTLEQAVYSGKMLGESLAKYLDNYIEK